MSHYQKSAFFENWLPIIWLKIIHEFISKIPSQKKGNFKNGLEHIKKSPTVGKKKFCGAYLSLAEKLFAYLSAYQS